MDFYLFWASAGQPSLCWPDNLLLGFCSLLSFHCSFGLSFFIAHLASRLSDYFGKITVGELIAISAVIFSGFVFAL